MHTIRVPRADCYYDDADSFAQDLKQDFLHPSRIFTPFVIRVLTSLFLAALIVLSVLRQLSPVSVISTLLLAVIFYIMLDNMGGDNAAGSLPFATYPIPPHLGIDGISLVNRSCVNGSC